MSGHSKWASIKHKKGAADAKRGQLFTKIIKEITIASRIGGGDAEANPRLRTVLLKAKASNMPKDNIDRAIKKGTGELEGVNYEEITYEGYGPGGVAILIDTLTDNKNRTAAEVRNLLSKGGGNMGTSGCVSYLFSKKGVIDFDAAQYQEDAVLEVALDAGALDVVNDGTVIEVLTAPEDLEKVALALEKAKFTNSLAEVQKIPETYTMLEKEQTRKVLNLIERLEEHEDVQNVYSNLDVPADFDYSEE